MDAKTADITTVSSTLVYSNAWMSLREDKIRRADGSEGIYAVVDKPDFALIIPSEGSGVWLIEQYRYPVSQRSWEFPQGTFPAEYNGTTEDLARLELRQETGILASSITLLGQLYSAKGLSSQGFTIWLAEDLTHGEPDREIEEQDMRQQWLSRGDFEAMIRDGRITDDATIAAYALWLLQ